MQTSITISKASLENSVGTRSNYLIFRNSKQETLVYYNCPKNANSSAKHFFMSHLGVIDQFKFLSDDIPQFKQTRSMYADKPDLINALPSKQPFAEFGREIDYKICLTREPVSRFLSAYSNRVVWHQDKQFGGLSIDEVLDRLLHGDFSNGHFLPQTYFLGHDLGYYDLACDIKELNKFESFVNNFFNKNAPFPHIQKKAGEVALTLNKQQINLIHKIYESDIELLKSK